MERIYLIGALKEPRIPALANILVNAGHNVFADWHAPGPETDQYWQQYENCRGRSYRQAIYGQHALAAFEFDKHHLDECTVAVLVMPAGKSAHLELGYCAGRGKRTYVLFDKEPERYDLMYLFADYVCFSVEELVYQLKSPTPVERDYRKRRAFSS